MMRTPTLASLCVHVLAGLGLLGGTAMAQTSPATLQTPQQRIQDYYQQRQQPEREVQEDPLKSQLPAIDDSSKAVSSVRFELKGVRFSTSTLLPTAALDDVANRYVGQTVGMAELSKMIDEINALYTAQQITTAQAMLSAQRIDQGIVHVNLIEGRLGKISVAGEGRVPEKFVRKRVHQKEGDVVDDDQLRDDLIFLNRTTDMTVRAVLMPGHGVGETDILVQADVPKTRNFAVFLDNAGIESTGRERIGVQGQFWGLAGINDLLMGAVAYAQGGLEGSVSYSGLVNRRNGRIGATISRNQIEIIDGAYRDLDITGDSTSYSLDFMQPFVATRRWLVSGSGSFGRSTSNTEISGVHVSKVDSDVMTIGVAVNRRGEGNEWNLQQNVSRIKVDEPLRNESEFTTAAGAMSWIQRIGKSGFNWRSQLGWQWSNAEGLPAGNLYQLGGIGSVRGYVRGALAGPKGYTLNLELHRPYKDKHDAYVFIDHGAISGFQESRSISSIGLGLAGEFGRRFRYSLDLGHPLDRALPEQDSVRADFRVTAFW